MGPAAMSGVFLGAAGMMALCFYFSVTLSPVIGLGLGTAAAALGVVRGGRAVIRAAAPWVLVGVVIAGGLGSVAYWRLPEQQQGRVQQVLHFRDPYGELRQEQWRAAFGLFRERPILGRGYGTFRTYSLERMSAEWYADLGQSAEKMFMPSYAHNEYLQVLADTGVIGGAVFCIRLGMMYAMAVRVSLRHPEGGWRRIGVGIVVAATAFLAQNFLGVTFHQTGGVTFFWLWLGVLAVAAAWGPGEGEGRGFDCAQPRPTSPHLAPSRAWSRGGAIRA